MPKDTPAEDPMKAIRAHLDSLSPDELLALANNVMTGDAYAARVTIPQIDPHIELPPPPDHPSALTLKVEVDGSQPLIWRRIVVHGDLTLEQLHEVLQSAIGWFDSHLHRFSPWAPLRERVPHFLTEFDIDEGEDGTPEADARVDQVLREPGDRLRYSYDFGDGWEHTIRLESMAPLVPHTPPAVCVAARFAAPLEDVGGIHTYNDLAAQYRADPSMPGLDPETRAWLPPAWDPDDADVDQLNLQISLAGAEDEAIFAAFTEAGGSSATWPDALEALHGLAPADVVAEIASLCVAAQEAPTLTPVEVATIVAPYRSLVGQAAGDGIPLTAAGWMKPAVVEQTFAQLGLQGDWYGAGNREQHTQPVAQLRRRCQELGLLRKYKGHLLTTTRAKKLTDDSAWLAVITTGLAADSHDVVRAAQGLFLLVTAATGHSDSQHAALVADLLTRCGFAFTTGPLDRWGAYDMCRTTWQDLNRAEGSWVFPDGGRTRPTPAAGLARLALWPAIDETR